MPIVPYNNASLKRKEYADMEKKCISEIIQRKQFRSTIIDGKKKCNKCLQMVSVYEFGTFLDKKTPKRYLNSMCKACARMRTNNWVKNNPERVRVMLDRANAERIANRAIIYKAYGDKCSCCGESNPLFLTLDHVNNDGHEIRPRNVSGNHYSQYSGTYYKRIIAAGFPKDLQLLCWNCNCGKARNGGVCPHITK